MPSNDCSFGFRIVGGAFGERRLVDWPTAFAAHCRCDERAEVEREAYLSAFMFTDDFAEHLEATGSTKGYAGRCGASWLWFDIDADDLGKATDDARRLCVGSADRYGMDADTLLIFFSGAKGFHVGLPMTLLGSPEPSDVFHKVARRFACDLAERHGITIDTGVFDKVRIFRAPNSLHPKTELSKRKLSFDELMGLKVAALVRLASAPEPFDVPAVAGDSAARCAVAVADWRAAAEAVAADAKALAERTQTLVGATLNRQTREFVIDGAVQGDRHRLLFSAAANLAEFGCPVSLAHALLTESALNSGLAPSDVKRQIDCGLAKGGER